MQTPFCARLGLKLPVVQAPMAGVSNAALAGAVSRAGGLGSIAVGAMAAPAADDAIARAMSETGGLLNVNVFTHGRPQRDPEREAAWLQRLEPYFTELGIRVPGALEEIYPTFDDTPELLDVLLTHRPPVVSLHFGLPAATSLRAFKDSGACVMATATSVPEARQLEAAGVDVIVAQGYEAGGHRGSFAGGRDECLPTFSLLPRLVAAVEVPVLAAGGIMNGGGITAAMTLGAASAQLGTVFADCPESAAGETYRRALGDENRATTMTALFSGRRARGIVNRFVDELGDWEHQVPEYPVAYDAAKRLAAAAVACGSHDFDAMWAGQGPVRERVLPAAELCRVLGEEIEDLVA